MVSAIQTELVKATGIKPKKGQDRQEFLAELVRYSQDELKDELWEDLSDETQEWANEGAKALEKGEEIPDFPTGGEEEEETKPKPAAKKKAASKKKTTKKVAAKDDGGDDDEGKKAPAKKKKASAKKAPAKKTPAKPAGAQVMIKKMIIKKPSITTDEILEKLEKSGLKASKLAVSTIRTGMRQSIKVLQEEGHLKELEQI